MQFITLDNIKRFFENITEKALVFSGKVQFDNDTIFTGHAEFDNDTIFTGHAEFDNDTIFTGHAEFDDSVDFNHPVVNNETVTVHGEQTNNSKVIMNGGIQVNSIVNKVSTTLLDMGEGQSITYKGEELATTDQINDLQDNLNDKLSISDGGTIDADVTFNSDTNFNAADGGVNVNTSALDISKNTYTTFNGDVEFNKGIDFNTTGAINFNGEVDFNENANVGGTLTANSNTVFNDGITVKQSTDDGKTFTTLFDTGSGVINYKGNEIATKKDVKTQDLSGYLTKTDASNLYLGKTAAAERATIANKDDKGNYIPSTYIKSLSATGSTITYTKGDGGTGSVTVDSGTKYELPEASATVLGGIKVGKGLSMTDGVLNSLFDSSKYMLSTDIWNNFLGKTATAVAAQKAEKDGNGNNIVNTYAKKTDLPTKASLDLSLSTSSWSNNTYTISNAAIKADSVVLFDAKTGSSTANAEAVWNAKIICKQQTNGSIILQATGGTPTVDLLISLVIFN